MFIIMLKKFTLPKITIASYLVVYSIIASAANLPPKNPWLADSIYAMGHGDSAQQDSLAVSGPIDSSRQLASNEIDFAAVGPGHFGSQITSIYPNGKRAIWSIGLDRISKLEHDSFEIIDEYFFPNAKRWTLEDANQSINKLDNNNDGFFAIYEGYQQSKKFRNLAGIYTLMDSDNLFYMMDMQGNIHVFGDKIQGDMNSPIELKKSVPIRNDATGKNIGLNMTYDGWIITVTEHGYVIALNRDLSTQHILKLNHAEGAENKATRPTGYGWVRNGYAIDKDGGIYIVSQEHMHKIVWTGEQLSKNTKDGAWTAPYLNEWEHGSGATPSLMGFDNEDQFVVITDGANIMNVVLFWRNQIPNNWQPIKDTLSPRIAGQLPANMGNESIQQIQSEQSVVVAGYGAMVVNNTPRNAPWYMPERAKSLLVSYLGSNPKHNPYGIHKFQWNQQKQQLEEAWVNNEVSSPNSVPIVSHNSNQVYFIGARQNQWTLEAVNWQTGDSTFHYSVGGQRYNSLFAGTLLDQSGRIFYGTGWGIVRLNPSN